MVRKERGRGRKRNRERDGVLAGAHQMKWVGGQQKRETLNSRGMRASEGAWRERGQSALLRTDGKYGNQTQTCTFYSPGFIANVSVLFSMLEGG